MLPKVTTSEKGEGGGMHHRRAHERDNQPIPELSHERATKNQVIGGLTTSGAKRATDPRGLEDCLPRRVTFTTVVLGKFHLVPLIFMAMHIPSPTSSLSSIKRWGFETPKTQSYACHLNHLTDFYLEKEQSESIASWETWRQTHVRDWLMLINAVMDGSSVFHLKSRLVHMLKLRGRTIGSKYARRHGKNGRLCGYLSKHNSSSSCGMYTCLALHIRD